MQLESCTPDRESCVSAAERSDCHCALGEFFLHYPYPNPNPGNRPSFPPSPQDAGVCDKSRVEIAFRVAFQFPTGPQQLAAFELPPFFSGPIAPGTRSGPDSLLSSKFVKV